MCSQTHLMVMKYLTLKNSNKIEKGLVFNVRQDIMHYGPAPDKVAFKYKHQAAAAQEA